MASDNNGITDLKTSFFNKVNKYSIVCLGRLIPFYNNGVLFTSLEGLYCDNPRVISVKLHEIAPEIPIYWGVSEKSREVLPDYVKKVQYYSLRYWLLAISSRVTVDTGMGPRSAMSRKKGFKTLGLKLYTDKRKKQLNIATWHGTPLKKILKDFSYRWKDGNRDETTFHCCADYVLAGCRFTRDKLVSSTDNTVPVKMYGTPRNDIFFDKSVDVLKIKEKLCLPLDKKIVLFAPTWRFSADRSGISQLETLDIPGLLEKLNEKFGGEYCFVFRAHSRVLLEVRKKKILEKYKGLIYDGTLKDDMAEYLLCTDILITDYSSSFYDFALTGRPCFLYAPDLEQYTVDQGFYVDYNGLPFPKAFTSRQLLDCVSGFDGKAYKIDLDAFVDGLGSIEDGKAAERVVNDIVQFFRTHKKELYITENGET